MGHCFKPDSLHAKVHSACDCQAECVHVPSLACLYLGTRLDLSNFYQCDTDTSRILPGRSLLVHSAGMHVER